MLCKASRQRAICSRLREGDSEAHGFLRGDQVGPEREVGSKIPIHNVELNPVHTSRFGDAAVRAYQRSIAIS